MELLHEQIEHLQFGNGVVTGQTETVITVQFAPQYGMKSFLSPSCFDHFITLTNPGKQTQLQTELDTQKAKEEALRQEKEDEERAHLAAVQIEALTKKKRTSTTKRTTTKRTAVKKQPK